ncbi:unnamed protein product [Chondrus crispus]|uniref:Uncharacterized protein n=1 Tax=Chondrus crispus TaxID=2769 RepID=R7QUZ1_CHOCR|nr:unnamed protein product [Chondrus crispus]CDF41175.1 unnamed protein product [Chondrus crispus]|eukprot:XP_005711468.1 unnamed protein product [Chondrus crispus]
MVSNGYIGDSFPNGFNNSGTFMTQHGWKQTLGIGATKCVRICVTYTRGKHFDADLVCFRGLDLDLFDDEIAIRTPGDRSTASDSSSCHGFNVRPTFTCFCRCEEVVNGAAWGRADKSEEIAVRFESIASN